MVEDDQPPLRSVTSTCPYCGVGCGIKMMVNGQDEIVEVQDGPDNLSSVGMLCVKGRFGTSFVNHPDRLTTPLIKEDGEFRPATCGDGLVITEMVESINRPDGVKAMYITGENPLLSEPDLHRAEESFRKLEFLVVQDIFLHETAQIADVVLPATSFAEKDGTFTNSERRVQRVRRAVAPRGESRPDWEIICDLGRRLSRRLGLDTKDQFTYNHPGEIFQEMARLTPIVRGISYQRLDHEGGIQWPCPSPNHPGTPMLHADIFPRGPRARFVPFEQGPVAAETSSRHFPLILNSGRVAEHWHGGTITRRVAELMARMPELQVSMNPADGKKYGIDDGRWVRVISRRGELTGKAVLTERMRSGEIFIPFVKLAESAANFLTNSAYDPDSKIPEYKVCAVRVQPVADDRTE